MKFLLSFSLVLIFSSLTVVAQIKSYDAQWKNVNDLLEKKNLPKSALEEVKKIYAMAKKENQEAQVIKALSYMVMIQDQTRENSGVLAIAEIEKEIAIAREPVSSILKSLLANLYLQYLQQNRYKFYGRTNTVDFNKNDIATWTLEDLHKKISDLYLQSIRNETLLKQTKLEPFNAIISKGNVRHLRPTLFDLLAHHALQYFQNNERDIKKPAYAFEIIQPQAFAPATIFTTYKFTTRDSLSLQHKALETYQKLMAFHLNDPKPDALIDVDIHRIQFVHSNSVAADKDSLYIDALKNLIQKYQGNSTAKQASFLLAQWHEIKASGYSAHGDTTYRYSRNLARAILLDVVKDSSVKSEGWINSMNLLRQIERHDFSFELERVNIPGQPFRALVRYKNINLLHFRLIKIDDAMRQILDEQRYDTKYWTTLINAKALKTWQQNLPATNDLQQHAVEIKIDQLPVGEYYLLASSDPQFDKKTTTLGSQLFYVSNISYVNHKDQYFVLNRETGQPLINATVQIFGKTYDYKTSKWTRSKLATHKTDYNGFFAATFSKKERQHEFYLDIVHENDRLNLRESIYRYYDGREPAPEKQTTIRSFFFTDRSIYRPGQLVYFKGISISSVNEQNEIAVNHKTTIYLRNANYEITDSLQVTTNEFGSYNGKFKLPQNLLNGNFTITDKEQTGNAFFSVEEYKRPKFYVEFEKIKNSYKVNETVKVNGNAKAYAGNNIDGAKVSYRVVRKPRFIYTWYFRKSWLPPVEEMEIAHGEVVTDKDGKFSIQFTAIPDKKLDPKTDPVFDYAIHADVTDINGETRSADKTVTAGYKSLILQVDLPEKLSADSLRQLIIRTENMNGEFQAAIVNVSVRKLISPDNRLIRNRYWEEPDQFVMTREEYIRFFPHDEYKNETDFKTWEKGELILTRQDSSRANGIFSLANTSLINGYYSIDITTKDKDGKEIKDTKYVEIYDPSSGNFNKPEYLWTKSSDEIVEPGSKTQMQIGSSAQNVFLVQQVDKIKEIKETFDFTRLNSEKKTFNYTATESDRGGFGVTFFFIKDNRFYQFNDAVNVPWSNKDVAIEYSTFRDKTLPGSEEKWKVKLTGYKNEKIAAEMLASMYDASLDQFKPHSWNKPGIWPLYSQHDSWSGFANFNSVQSDMKQVYEEYLENKKQYDWFDFGTGYDGPRPPSPYRGIRTRKDATGSVAVIANGAAPTAQAESADSASGYEVLGKVTGEMQASSLTLGGIKKTEQDPTIQPRKNFNETAFFFPDLRTDENGNIEFSFTAPEALTKWKLQTLAHTKGLAFGFTSKEMVTQKELMVQPNMTRFLRQGDRMELVAKIVNMSDKEMTGQAQLQLFDATTNQSVDGWFINSFPNQYFTVAPGQSELVKFPIQVPFQFTNALTWRITARSGNFTDGEEEAVAVLTNKTLVTETMPLPMRGSGTKNFSFEKLLKSGNSATLQNQSITVEYTSNPAWYAVQALPYLMEYPYECAEQIWNRYYANALASKIANASPRLKNIFSQWSEADTAALLSNLQKNQELKSALLEETPWVLQAKTEAEQKKNIALLFDMVRMSNEMSGNLEKLKTMQSSNGGFVWFIGGPDDRYITQYIITGIGHLKKLGVNVDNLNSILKIAIPYLDKKIKEDYDNLVKRKADLKKQQVGYYEIQYLYMRSFFPENKIPAVSQTAYNFYKKQSQQFWVKQNKYMQGMIALALNRSGDKTTPAAILKSLDETSIKHEELGMYWKENTFGYSWNWWYAPIETHSSMIEAFSEIGNDTRKVDDLRTWLIKNKQTNNWRTTKATADACYAMLLQGSNWLDNQPDVEIQLGSLAPLSARRGVGGEAASGEAGTGYFKRTVDAQKIKPELGNISLTVKQPVNPSTGQSANAASWGSVYWQYFEDLDKITTASTPLQLNKKLFIEKNTDRGPVLSPVADGTELHVGDKIKVRIELRVDRDMEYVHMKDMRASALEPVNVLSGYKWQGGLGYYESTKDASTNFFFNYLRKGTYVFEYALFVSHTGNFSNGITTIQCMYAPEFTAHSEGVRINVE